MKTPVFENGPSEQKVDVTAKITAVEAAWWLSTGQADPTLACRFMHGSPDDASRPEHIAAQVSRLIDAAEAAGIRDALFGILATLFRQSAAVDEAAQLHGSAALFSDSSVNHRKE